MRENGQISRMWQKWGSAFRTDCHKNSGTDPMRFQDVTVAFVILMGAMTLVLILLVAEKRMKNYKLGRGCQKWARGGKRLAKGTKQRKTKTIVMQ